MKFTVTMKTPDAVHEAMHYAVLQDVSDISDEERDFIYDERYETVSKLMKKWFRYQEYITLEVDTEAKTCVVVENK